MWNDIFNKCTEIGLPQSVHCRVHKMLRSQFAAPQSNVGSDILALAEMNKNLYEHSLGSFKDLAHKMFQDRALGKSLNKRDPLRTSSCNPNFDENFGREWFELFTAGNEHHNRWDIQALSKALNPGCCSVYSDRFKNGELFLADKMQCTADTAIELPGTTSSAANCLEKCQEGSASGFNFDSLKFGAPLNGVSWNDETQQCKCCHGVSPGNEDGFTTYNFVKGSWMQEDGIFLKKDQMYCLETQENVDNLVDKMLDTKDTDEVEIAAKWLCSTVFKEFAHVNLDMRGPDLAACGSYVVSNEWNIAAAVQHVVKSKFFYSQLGNKLAAPMMVVYGAAKDFGLTFTDKRARQMFNLVQRAPYKYRDVNGYEDDIMSDQTLTGLHKFFSWLVADKVKKMATTNEFNVGRERKDRKWVNKDATELKENFETNFAEFIKNTDAGSEYSIHFKTCPAGHVQVESPITDLADDELDGDLEKEMDQLDVEDVDSFFASHNKWTNFKKWRTTSLEALGNPCQFVC
jgi:hypothetical protein